MPNGLVSIVLTALLAVVGAGVALQAMDSGSHNLVTVEGRVTALEWNPHWNVTVEFQLKTANGTYQVELGPPWWFADHPAPAIRLNDTVKVEGELEANNTVEAYTIWVNGGPAFVIRGPGMPPWAQERSGQTGEHPEEEDTDSE